MDEAASPGLITGAADDDPSGIATYSQAGAQFGFGLLWTLLITYPLMVSIQLVSARMGRVTGSGLATNLRRHYPAPLLYLAVLVLLAANIINIAADLAAMGAAAKLVIGGPVQLYVALFGTVSLLMQVFIPYQRYANILKWLTLVLFAYVAIIFVIPIDWKAVGLSLVKPPIQFSGDYLTTVVARCSAQPSAPTSSSGRRRRKSRKSAPSPCRKRYCARRSRRPRN